MSTTRGVRPHTAGLPSKKKKKRRKPPSEESLKRLSTPHARKSGQISALQDDINNCYFTPTISKQAQGMTKGFMKRLERSHAEHKAKKNKEAPLDPECTFVPRKFGKATHLVEGGTDKFFERMEEDIALRREVLDYNATKELCPFRPQIPESKFNKKSKAANRSFMDRMLEDATIRQDGKSAREQEAIGRELGSCTFHPAVHKPSPTPNFKSFLVRYENDMEEREQKEIVRNKLLDSKPKITPIAFSNLYFKMKAKNQR